MSLFPKTTICNLNCFDSCFDTGCVTAGLFVGVVVDVVVVVDAVVDAVAAGAVVSVCLGAAAGAGDAVIGVTFCSVAGVLPATEAVVPVSVVPDCDVSALEPRSR